VAMWFGTTPDEALVDPGFPRRFVPRAFDAIMRHSAHLLLPEPTSPPMSPTAGAQPEPFPDEPAELTSGPVPTELGACQAALIEVRAALTEMRRQRDALKSTIDTIGHLAQGGPVSLPAASLT
jgi:hypothetical protein